MLELVKIQCFLKLSCMELGRDWNGTGTGREPVRDGTKTEPIFVLFYDVPFKVLSQYRPKSRTT